jgi:hypothetical protein
MGTRGIMGFRLKGKDYLTYNHFDSYPAGLGEKMVEFILNSKMNRIAPKVKALRLVDSNSKPTDEDKMNLRQYCDTGVSHQSADDWYCLLRNTQGDPYLALKAGVMIDSHEFVADSLFCEYAYVINLDDKVLEVYRGYQKRPHAAGRYSSVTPQKNHEGKVEYWPIALLCSIPFEKLNSKTMAKVHKMLDKGE